VVISEPVSTIGLCQDDVRALRAGVVHRITKIYRAHQDANPPILKGSAETRKSDAA
jgi:hypothetical protein